jgi:peroxiredoxin
MDRQNRDSSALAAPLMWMHASVLERQARFCGNLGYKGTRCSDYSETHKDEGVLLKENAIKGGLKIQVV